MFPDLRFREAKRKVDKEALQLNDSDADVADTQLDLRDSINA